MRPEIEKAVSLLNGKDPAALEQALSLLQDTVFSFSMKVCGQREDAEDTMQDVLVKSLPYLPRFESPRALLVWLYKVAKNRCLMSRRKSRFAPNESLSLENLMPDRRELERLSGKRDVNPEAFAIRSEQAHRLREAIQKLPPQYRIILVLHDMEGLTDDEVGEITGLRPGTVRVRLHRARLFVRKEVAAALAGKSRRRGRAAPASLAAPPVPRPMRCRAMFAELSEYLDDELDPSLCEELEKHLEGCAPCKAFLLSLEAMIQQFRKTPAVSPDRARAAKLRRELLARYAELFTQSPGRLND